MAGVLIVYRPFTYLINLQHQYDTSSAEDIIVFIIVTSYDCLFSVVSCPLSWGYCKLESLLQIFTVQPLKTVYVCGSIALTMQLSCAT
jgi:hypothetical protein